MQRRRTSNTPFTMFCNEDAPEPPGRKGSAASDERDEEGYDEAMEMVEWAASVSPRRSPLVSREPVRLQDHCFSA